MAKESVEAHPTDWVPEDAVLLRGREIYLETCKTCHNNGLDMAPRITSSSAWGKRLVKGPEVLTRNAYEGFHGEWGEMPAKGGEDSYTREDIGAAVAYITAVVERNP
ncbi:MAG: c-type cytochrome [Verrucomicrobiota bacterium]